MSVDVAATLGWRAPLRLPAFRRLWASGMLITFSFQLERVAIGWLVLDRTGSPLLAALTFAVRSAPNLVVGPLGGAAADRFPRARLLATSMTVRAVAFGALGLLVLSGIDGVALMLGFVAVSGVLKTFEMPAEQALIVDIVGREQSGTAIGIHSLGGRTTGLLGALAGGVVTEWAGSGEALLIGALVLVPVVILLLGVHIEAKPRRGVQASLVSEALAGIRFLFSSPVVAALLAFAMGVEVLGFAYQSLLPAFAREVLRVDAAGLGVITAAAGLGGVGGALLLSILGRIRHRGLLLLGVTLAYGALLLASASTDVFLFAALTLAGVGACAAMFDGLQWVLLQLNVSEEMRGRAIGGWVWAIGWGWLGPVCLGALAEWLGVPEAFATAGIAVMALAVAGGLLIPSMRRA